MQGRDQLDSAPSGPRSEGQDPPHCAEALEHDGGPGKPAEHLSAGFADLFHFSHRFTRRYGVSPSTYRTAGTANESALDHPGVRRLALALWE